jgi:hypothetical protein
VPPDGVHRAGWPVLQGKTGSNCLLRCVRRKVIGRSSLRSRACPSKSPSVLAATRTRRLPCAPSRAQPSCPRPSCSPCRRRFLLQRREDDAVAVSVHGPAAVTPRLGTQPGIGDRYASSDQINRSRGLDAGVGVEATDRRGMTSTLGGRPDRRPVLAPFRGQGHTCPQSMSSSFPSAGLPSLRGARTPSPSG